MRIFYDQMNREVRVPEFPQRIISLVPSQSELLYDLGLEKKLVGVTKFCVHPPQLRKEKINIGGTKNFHLDRIQDLAPDLIIGNKEENEKNAILELAEQYPVWMSDIYSLEEALVMIESLGELTHHQADARSLQQKIRADFQQLANGNFPRLRVVYLIWRKPYMVAGSPTFIDDMLRRIGFENIFAQRGRYPQITKEDLQAADPELILLSSEPFPFKEKHLEEFQKICPKAHIQIVDGEMFSWYGSRLQYAGTYFKHLREAIT